VYLSNRKGVWYAVGKIGGVLYRESTGFRGAVGSKGYRSAQRKLVTIEHEIREDLEGWLKAPIPTVEEYWKDTYRPTYTERKRAPEMDDRVMAHAIPVLGAFRLDQVTTSDCERYLNDRRRAFRANPGHKMPKRLSEGTVQLERRRLATIFRRAVDDGLIDRNPWKAVKAKPDDVRDRVLTDAEQRELLARLSPRFQRFVLFVLGTGIRLEECRGIDPKTDMDLDARVLRVTGKYGKTREVPIPTDLVPVIKAQLKADGGLWKQNAQRLRMVLVRACREVTPSPDGTRPQWQRKAQAAIAHLSPHAFRHTFVHRWLKGGGDIYALSRILGHESIAVTQRHYAKLLTEDLRAKMDAVDLGLPKVAKKGRVLAMRKRA
jgi:integrase